MTRRIAVSAALLTLVAFPAVASPRLDVTITSGPAGTTAAGTASFIFAANERAALGCSLDGAPLASCVSPTFYRALADGPHTFVVEARNRDATGAEYVDTDSRSWTVDRSQHEPPVGTPLVPGVPPDAGGPGAAPGANADTDGDGVGPGADRCPATPPGLSPLAAGCAALEIVVAPLSFGVDADEALDDALRWQRSRSPKLRKGLVALRRAHSGLARALELVGEGGPCEGARRAGVALGDLSLGKRRLGRLYGRLERRLLKARSPRGDGAPAAIVGLSIARRLDASARREAVELRSLLGRLCTAVGGPRRLSGAIAAIDDSRRLLTLADGTVVAFGDALRGRRPYEGSAAVVRARALAGGGAIATEIKTEPGTAADGSKPPATSVETASVGCLELRIAPVQPFYPPLPVVDPYTLHRPGVYGNKPLHLERDMRIAAAKTCGEPGDPGSASAGYTVRSLRVRLSYTSSVTHKKVSDKLLAAELAPGDAPVPLPSDVDPNFQGKLELLAQAKTCSSLTVLGQPPACGPPKPGASKLYDVSVKPNGYYASAQYSRTQFELDTKPVGSFQAAQVEQIGTGPVLAGRTLSFSARGYSAAGGSSSRPASAAIGKGDPFAVYLDDIFGPDLLFPEASTGVDRPSGLIWPRVKGKRGGQEFWYLAHLPKLTRDRVDTCTGIDSYYRLPFGHVSTWRLGNGNFDDPNGGGHAKGKGVGNDQRYAFDFGYDTSDLGNLGNEGAEVRAARPGVVVDLQKGESGNSWADGTTQEDGTKEDGPTPAGYGGVGNFVVIEHDDGTFSAYWHNRKNTTAVSVGERVRRGQLLALSGNTGNSSEPHLHWDVRVDWHLAYPAEFVEFPSTLAKVQDSNHTCWRPREADSYDSNNELTP